MEQISANELYNRILNSGLLSASGAINFELNGTSVTIKTTDIVGNCIQSWLKQWMIDNNIYCSEPHNTQIFPDFYLSNETTTNLLEVKAFNYNASPAFDIANFEAYCASLESKAYRLDADYIIFGYTMDNVGNVEIKNLTFGYSRLADPLIKNFDLNLKPGSRVAFVGSSGCGKSTIAKLISGLYQPWEGEILFDGKKMSEIDRSVFTGSIAVVDQDIILFEDTIANNIKMWDTSIEDFEMIMAARDANLHEDIMQRDGGYNYKLIEGGRDFSGGQRQRMEIARVLAQDPTIIILDEATSALDAKTEYEVVKSIKDRGITCIVVAHRLSTIRDCDEIIVMDHGNVVQRGTHKELYAQEGLYRQLVSNE